MCTDKHTILLYLCKQLTTVNVVATYCMTTHKEIAPCLMQACYKVKIPWNRNVSYLIATLLNGCQQLLNTL